MDYRQKLREKLGIFYNEEEDDFHDEYTDMEDQVDKYRDTLEFDAGYEAWNSGDRSTRGDPGYDAGIWAAEQDAQDDDKERWKNQLDGVGEFEEDASLKSLSDRLQQRFYQGSLRETEIEPEGMEEPVEPMDGEAEEDDFSSDLPPIDSDDDTMSGEMETGDGETVDMEITPEQKKLENSQKIAEKMLDEIMKPIRREANEIEESDINNGMMLRKFYEYVYTNKDKIASFMSKGIK